ncbi:hypothetical protein [Parafannyhessea umbonata]|uniref:hypothetical protein n=1 Tax=Parafannyhessea umbonata TaxID=604330 RepID=UPI003AB7D069
MRESIFSPAPALPATWPSDAVWWPLPYTSTSVVTLGDASDCDVSLDVAASSAGEGSVVVDSVPAWLAEAVPSTVVLPEASDATQGVRSLVIVALLTAVGAVGAAPSCAVACSSSALPITVSVCALDCWASACADVVAAVVEDVGCVAVGSVAYAATGVPTSARPMTTAILADLPDAKYK